MRLFFLFCISSFSIIPDIGITGTNFIKSVNNKQNAAIPVKVNAHSTQVAV
jgi:hypothetical protein